MVKAVNFDKSSKVLIEGANAVDLDKPDDVVTIRFAYVIEARFITGIYYNKKTVDRAIQAFYIEDHKPTMVAKIEIADIKVSSHDSIFFKGADHDIDKVRLVVGDLTPTPDYIKGLNTSDK